MSEPGKIIKGLVDAGLTEQRIVELLRKKGVDVNQSTINRLKTGRHSQPRYELGAALVELRDRIKSAGA